MKKRPVSATKGNKRLCPLSDSSIGIISENDHKVGLCLCRYCDCGEHKCPVLDKNNIHLKSAFLSNYMKDFKKSACIDICLKPQPKLFQPNTHKMDLKTTNQNDYRPIKISSKKNKFISPDNNKAQFRGYTIYANDFPNWGENVVSREKAWHPPVRSTEIAFKGTSTYKEAFSERTSKSAKHFKTSIEDIPASKSKISFAPKDKFHASSTYKTDMCDFSSSNLNHKIVITPKKSIEMKIPISHFSTTSKNCFNNSSFSPDPRLYKISLIARSYSAKKTK